jgi:hypothetical protein
MNRVFHSLLSLRAAEYDLVISQAKKMGKSVVIVSPDKHLGGLSAGGLGFTDTGNKAVIGGLDRDFYHRIWRHYDAEAAWKWQKKFDYGGEGQGTPAVDGENRTMWIFEPSAAEKVFESYVKEFALPVVRDEWLDRAKGVKKDGSRITQITTLSGRLTLEKCSSTPPTKATSACIFPRLTKSPTARSCRGAAKPIICSSPWPCPPHISPTAASAWSPSS